MGKYTQLTQEQRYQIYAFMKANFSQTDIAQEIGVNKSTICRELKRNQGLKGYRPKQAHIMAVDRRKKALNNYLSFPKISRAITIFSTSLVPS